MANIVYSIIWLLVLIIVAFWISGFCAFWYIILYPLTVCVPDLSVVTDFLLKIVQFPHYCELRIITLDKLSINLPSIITGADGMMSGKPLF